MGEAVEVLAFFLEEFVPPPAGSVDEFSESNPLGGIATSTTPAVASHCLVAPYMVLRTLITVWRVSGPPRAEPLIRTLHTMTMWVDRLQPALHAITFFCPNIDIAMDRRNGWMYGKVSE